MTDFDPDAAVPDIDLGPGPSGFDLGRQLARTRPDVAVLFLTDKPEAMAAPPDSQSLPTHAGFLLKRRTRDMDTLVEALESAIAERMGVSESSVERWLVALFRAMGIESHGPTNPRVVAARRYIAAGGLPEMPQ